MEYSIEGTTQGCAFANAGACTVNLPSPKQFAIHKLIVYGERPIREPVKATTELLQAAAIVERCVENGPGEELEAAWANAVGRGRGRKAQTQADRQAILRQAPSLIFA